MMKKNIRDNLSNSWADSFCPWVVRVRLWLLFEFATRDGFTYYFLANATAFEANSKEIGVNDKAPEANDKDVLVNATDLAVNDKLPGANGKNVLSNARGPLANSPTSLTNATDLEANDKNVLAYAATPFTNDKPLGVNACGCPFRKQK